ncbi:helix-turn-helix domain-containing protein [Spongiimicrobium salis]|uniref:helix-turn-helix domain-containing protein n=1 Tax=Spongiimicrobium salis TaxID=1667022 RepID=UPI00374CDDEC
MFILKQLRREKNCSQTELATAIGVSLRTIQLYERKEANIPRKNLTKLAAYFNLSISQLYEYEINEQTAVYQNEPPSLNKLSSVKSLGNGKYEVTAPLILTNDYEAYAKKFLDIDYMKDLHKASFVTDNMADGNFRAFEILGSAMNNGKLNGIPNGTIVLARELPKEALFVDSIKHFNCVLLYKSALLCKQINDFDNSKKTIRCHSLNESPEYADFEIPLRDIYKVFVIVKKLIN